jgi:hypothetical protein
MHEQSQTIERDGRFYNVNGTTGEVLAPKLPTEKESYDTVEEAVQQAKARAASTFEAPPAPTGDPVETVAQEMSRLSREAAYIVPDIGFADPQRAMDVYRAWQRAEITHDEYYLAERQRADDEANLLFQDIARDRQAEAAQTQADQAERDAAMSERPGVGGERSGPDRTTVGMAPGDSEVPEVRMGLTRTGPRLGRGYVTDVAAGVPHGVLKALDAAAEAAAAFSEWATGLDLTRMKDAKFAGIVGAPQTVPGEVAAGAAQFFTGFVPMFSGMKAAGVGAWLAGLLADPLASALVFDPHDPRLSNLLLQSGVAPNMSRPILEFLAADPEDTQVQGRLKNALENLGLGVLAEGLIKLGTTVARSRALRKAVTDAGVILGSERGSIPIAPNRLEDLARSYRELVALKRRGVRPHAVAHAEADALIKAGGVSTDTLKALAPGTAMDDTHAAAAVTVMTESGLRLRALAKQYLVSRDPTDLHAALQQLWVHAEADPARLGILAESGRTQSVLNDPMSGLNAFLSQIESILFDAKRGVTPEGLMKTLAEMKDPGQLAVAARALRKPGWAGAFKEYIVNGMLWGPVSWIANGLGSAVTLGMAPAERAAAEVAGRVVGATRGVVAGETHALVSGMVENTFDAWRVAWSAFKDEESKFAKLVVTDPFERLAGTQSTKFGERIPAISSENLDLTGVPGRAVDFLGTMIRVPQRIMTATDDFFKVINYQGELKALAHRQAFQEAREQGLTGRAFGDYLRTRVPQITADPPLTAVRQAKEFALYQTFTKDLDGKGLLDTAGRGLSAVSEHPVGKLVVPFVKTPVNIAKYAGERTPLGFLMRDFWTDVTGPDIAKRELALAKLALGSTTMAGVATLAYMGIVTGGGPKETEIKRHLRAQGWQAYSINVSALKRLASGGNPAPQSGDTLLGYNRLDPVGMVFGLAADWTAAYSSIDPEDGAPMVEQYTKAAAAIAAATAKNLSSKTFVRGLAETMNAVVDPERFADRSASTFLSMLIPFSAAVRLGERIADPTLVEADDFLDRLAGQVPGLSKDLPPYRDTWGRPYAPAGVYGPVPIATIETDPVLRELVRLGVQMPKVPKAIEKIRMEPAERDYFATQRGADLKLDGKTLRETLDAEMKSSDYRAGSDEYKRYMIHTWTTVFHEAAKDATLEKFEMLRRSVEAAQIDKANKLDAPASPQDATTPLLRSLGR